MMNFGYNNRWIRLVKDLVFVGLGVWLLLSYRNFLATLVGLFALIWYGRDAWFQIKVLWQEKHYEPANPVKTAPKDDKITVSQDAKEVNFEKE